MQFEGFIGPSSPARSVNVDLERTMNLYFESGGNGGATPKTRAALYGTPGLSLFGTMAQTPIRGLWANATRLFAVGGSKIYEVSNAGAGTLLGDVGNDGLPVQIFPNGNQLLIVSAGKAYCDNGAGPVQCSLGTAFTGTVMIVFHAGNSIVNWISGDQFLPSMAGATITIGGVPYVVSSSFTITPTQMHLTTAPGGTVDPTAFTCTPVLLASQGAFLDGYFIVSVPSTRQINISSINDGTTWSALDFGLKEGYPDYIVAIKADHEELWLFGTDTTEVWQNTGAASFPLARIPGAFIHHGCIAAWSPVRLKNGLAWLSSDPERGGVRALFAQGFTPDQISFQAVPTAWEAYSTVTDAVSFSYVEGGHEFWVITFPTANATWAFDITEGNWTQRGWWNGTTNDRQRQMFHAYVFGKHIVGDWSNGKLYQQAVSILDDAGTAIHWERTAPHVSNEQKETFYASFQLDMEVGTSVSAPSVSLSWSDDGGHTFNTPLVMVPRKANYSGRMMRRRLGHSRDRVFKVIGSSGAVKVALLQALIEAQVGIS